MPEEQDGQPSGRLANVALVIPAYNAGHAPMELLAELADRGFGAVVVVDDGSREPDRLLLNAACQASGSVLLRHTENRGKGRALKTGFAYLREYGGRIDIVVTADADGQHLVADIVRVAERCVESVADGRRPTVAMGVRAFEGRTPLRSRFGNWCTRKLFVQLTGKRIQDTQTGLRTFPMELMGWLESVEGERYEYESAVLARLCAAGESVREVAIATVYLGGNKGSHFRVWSDSARVWRALWRERRRAAAPHVQRSSRAPDSST